MRRYLIAFSLFLSACSADNDNNAPLYRNGTLVRYTKAKPASGNPTIQSEYKYDNKGRIVERISYKNFDTKLVSSKATYKYENNRLVSSDAKFDFSSSFNDTAYAYSRATFEYGSGELITKMNISQQRSNSQFEPVSIRTFEYNSAGQLTRANLLNPNGSLGAYEIFTHSNGNISRVESYRMLNVNQPFLQYFDVYEYDDKPNPLGSAYLKTEIPAFSISRNNIVKQTSTNYNVTPTGETSTSVTTFQYHGTGYPSEFSTNGNQFLYEYY